jgi:hypothetical protein
VADPADVFSLFLTIFLDLKASVSKPFECALFYAPLPHNSFAAQPLPHNSFAVAIPSLLQFHRCCNSIVVTIPSLFARGSTRALMLSQVFTRYMAAAVDTGGMHCAGAASLSMRVIRDAPLQKQRSKSPSWMPLFTKVNQPQDYVARVRHHADSADKRVVWRLSMRLIDRCVCLLLVYFQWQGLATSSVVALRSWKATGMPPRPLLPPL